MPCIYYKVSTCLLNDTGAWQRSQVPMGGKWHILSVSQFNVGLPGPLSKESLGECLSHRIVVFLELLTSLVFITTHMIKIQDTIDPVNSGGDSERKE